MCLWVSDKDVFANIKRQSQEDPFIQAMMKAREAELKIKAMDDIKASEVESKTEKVEASTTETTPTTHI